jgi:sugar O-acyltransferase (sialic acid O-acetyltransferase NeuD family)
MGEGWFETSLTGKGGAVDRAGAEKKRQRIVLVGGGGHCRSCLDAIESSQLWDIIGILDLPERMGAQVQGHAVIGSDEAMAGLVTSADPCFLVTLGQLQNPAPRLRLFEELKRAGARLARVQAGTAICSRWSTLGEGSILMQGTLVNAGARIGANCIINSGALIEHGAWIGDHCHCSTRCVVNGDGRVGNYCFIGSGAIVLNGVSLCDGCIIGAGAVVLRDITEPGTYAGNPASRIG